MNPVYTKLIFVSLVSLAIIGYWVFNFIVLYHLNRFGVGTQPKKFAAIFLLGSILLFSASVLLAGNLDFNSVANQFQKIADNMFNITNQK